MWRLRSTVILGVLAGVMIFGALTAFGGWWWNAKIDVEGVELRTIWEVTDQPGDNDAYYYTTDFTVVIPKEANATIIEQASNETVTITTSKKLDCLANDLEMEVKAKVTALEGATGTQAKVTLTADGVVVSEKTGKVGRWIKQSLDFPAICSGS